MAEFRDEFCTLCWSHRIKGKVLTDEQIATCRSQLAAAEEKNRWRDDFARWQKRMLIPAILMTLWCAYWGLSMVRPYLKHEDVLLPLMVGLLCAGAFAIGGFLAGGMKAVPLACGLLILASLVCLLHAGGYLLMALEAPREHVAGLLWSTARLVFCGTILVSAVMMFRIKRGAEITQTR